MSAKVSYLSYINFKVIDPKLNCVVSPQKVVISVVSSQLKGWKKPIKAKKTIELTITTVYPSTPPGKSEIDL